MPGLKIDHATVSIVFCAIAIEAALNYFLSSPLFFIEDNHVRDFVGAQLDTSQRQSIRSKIKLAKRFSSKLSDQGDLVKKIHEIIDYRNELVHPKLNYINVNSYPYDSNGSTDEGVETESMIIGKLTGSDVVAKAFDYYSYSVEFLEKIEFVGEKG